MAKVQPKTLRHQVWVLWDNGCENDLIAERLSMKLDAVKKITKNFDGSKRMHELKERTQRYYVPEVQSTEKTLFEKISENVSFSNQFVLLTNNPYVQNAYHNMVTRKNVDIPM